MTADEPVRGVILDARVFTGRLETPVRGVILFVRVCTRRLET
ncbi:MAG TPA: hypothetical protein VF955_07450 [Pyrinomonadaceae bacterium]